MEMNTLDELERLLKAGTPGPWKIERGKRCIQGPDTFEGEPLVLASMMGGRQWSASPYSQYCVPGMKDGDANAALIVAAINALPGLIESARRVEISAWTDDDQRGLNAAVADAMWHWDDMPMDCDDATVLTNVLKSSLQNNGFQIVRLAAALAKDATT